MSSVKVSLATRWENIPYHFAPIPDDWDLLRLKLLAGSAVSAQAFVKPVLVKTRKRSKRKRLNSSVPRG